SATPKDHFTTKCIGPNQKARHGVWGVGYGAAWIQYSGTLLIVLSCSSESYCRTTHIHGRAHSSTPSGTSRTSLRQPPNMLRACVQFLRSIGGCGNQTC